MRPTTDQAMVVVDLACNQIGQERPRSKCVEFVREIYSLVGIEIPPINPDLPPPAEFNLVRKELADPPPGHLVFLRNRTTTTPRQWTHVAITAPGRMLVHRSRFWGPKVVMTPLDDVLQFYDFAESTSS